MGHPCHRVRGVIYRRLWSSRLVHGLGPQTRICAICRVSHCDWDCGARLGCSNVGTLIARNGNLEAIPLLSPCALSGSPDLFVSDALSSLLMVVLQPRSPSLRPICGRGPVVICGRSG